MKILILFLLIISSCSKKDEDPSIPQNSINGEIFSSAGSTEENLVKLDHVKGVLIRVYWKDLESSPGNFNWNLIENQLTYIKKYNKQWSLAVLAGSFSPSWIYQSPYNVNYMNLTFRGNPVKVPLIQEQPLQSRLKLLIDALGNRFGNDPSLKLIYLPQMTLNGVEGHFNGISNNTLESQNFSQNDWITYSLEDLRYLASKFPNKKVAIELHEILGSSKVAKDLMDSIISNKEQNQIGVAIWWLSGRDDYQKDILDLFKSFTNQKGSIYAQLIADLSTPSSFYLNDFKTAFTQAKEIGIYYIEVWNTDVVRSDWFDFFQDFNQIQ